MLLEKEYFYDTKNMNYKKKLLLYKNDLFPLHYKSFDNTNK